MSYRGGRLPPKIEGMTSIKVDNIPYMTQPADLQRMFEKYGEIGDIHIPRDKYSGSSKGFAFVRFVNRRDAEYAIERTDGRSHDGRELRVAMAQFERPVDHHGHQVRSSRRDHSPRRRSRSRSRDRRRRSRSRSRDRRRSRSRSNDRGRERSRSRSNDRARSRSRSPTPKRNGNGDRAASRSHSPSRSPSR